MKIDFHVHTNDSPCSDLTIEKVIERAVAIGISGVAICNHDKKFDLANLPSGIEEKYNIKINPDFDCKNAFYIIPGIERSTSIGHILELFFLEETVAIIAHPFEKQKEYINRTKELLSNKTMFSVIECGSGRANYKNKSACSMAKRFAIENAFPVCAGSDAHFIYEIGNAWTELPDVVGLTRIKNALLNNKANVCYKNEKRTTVAKSQILKRGTTFKTLSFLLYCYIRDIGDKICQRSN